LRSRGRRRSTKSIGWAPEGDAAARAELTGLAAALAASPRSGFSHALRDPGPPVRRVFRLVEPLLPQALAVQLRRRLADTLRRLRGLRRAGLHGVARETIKRRIREATGLSPRTIKQIVASRRGSLAPDAGNALAALSGRITDHLVDRVKLFRTMARLERQAGRDLIAATYGLRIMRWLGRDGFGDLPFVAAALRAHGFAHEADPAEAMFGGGDDTEARCLELMRDAYRRNRHNSDPPLAVDDRRGDAARRVCVVVSLYNAADKLPTLLACLAQQSLARRGELEVVLVDSNSPADERAAMEGFLARQPLPVAFARSAERETIQQAWNRGIKLARAPYLAFLGADEGLHPDALRQLADALDADPRADWAMADSLVTEVDAAGVYAGDVKAYDRTGYRQDLVYLDTCYLSWVGGLYRRSIHDRFGYYDASFRAAGDTEFKNRILPHIRSVHVPRMLGVFNNYPEARTTASPRAEIEDLRAWYLWRTPAGMRYAFAERPAEDAMALLRTALNYRKSDCRHLSSDFDLADALARYLATRADAPAAWVGGAAQATGEAVAMLRGLEQLPDTLARGPGGLNVARHVFARVYGARVKMAERHRVQFNLPARPTYEVFNDNRYDQHWWPWSKG